MPISCAINNPLIELSSREELAKIAGYGEEKLSTVFLHGTLLCGDHTPHPVQGFYFFFIFNFFNNIDCIFGPN